MERPDPENKAPETLISAEMLTPNVVAPRFPTPHPAAHEIPRIGLRQLSRPPHFSFCHPVDIGGASEEVERKAQWRRGRQLFKSASGELRSRSDVIGSGSVGMAKQAGLETEIG